MTATAPSQKTPPSDDGPRCVVLLDDEKAYLELLGESLRGSLACPVVGFTNPQRCLDTLPNLRVGMIITDFQMPGLNGVEFIEKAQRLCPEVPVLMITAYAYEIPPQQLAKLPALKGIVNKPFRWPQLAEQIAKHWPSTTTAPFASGA